MDHDVIVIGGGAAGLSAAVALARSRRDVLVVDAGEPRNAPAAGVHNILSRDGIAPADLLAAGRDEVRRYGGDVRDGRVESAERLGDGFAVTLGDGDRLTARRLVVTTGVVDELPDVEGLRERWGRDVLHCPYCHGWEVRDRVIGVLATHPMAGHVALMFRQLSDRVTVITEPGLLDATALARLRRADIAVVEGEAVAVETEDDALSGVRLRDGGRLPVEALVVTPRSIARSQVLEALGVATADHPMGVGTLVPADELGRTSTPGVFVAGNLTDLSMQVMGAAAAGTRVGAAVNMDLIESDLMQERVA